MASPRWSKPAAIAPPIASWNSSRHLELGTGLLQAVQHGRITAADLAQRENPGRSHIATLANGGANHNALAMPPLWRHTIQPEKRRPPYDIEAIKIACFSIETLAITSSALRDSIALGFDRPGIAENIMDTDHKNKESTNSERTNS